MNEKQENTIFHTEDSVQDIGEILERIAHRQDRIYVKVNVLEKLMTVIANGGKIHQIGGYAYGRTSGNDPFILLYAPHDSMVHKICRVYPEDFSKLPHFIPTGNPPTSASELNLTKTELKKQSLYHGCATFKIATIDGKDTQMGPEIRFYDTMSVDREVLDELEATIVTVASPPAVATAIVEHQSAAIKQLPGTTNVQGETLKKFNQSIIKAEGRPIYGNKEPVASNAMPFYDQYVSVNNSLPQDLQALRDWYSENYTGALNEEN